MVHYTPAVPDISTLRLGVGQRALGQFAQLPLQNAPEGDAQSDLAGDAFWELFSTEPQRLDEAPAERAVNRQLLDWMRETHGFEASRAATAANMPASMTAASLMWDLLTTDEAMKEALERQERAAQQAQQARQAQAQANALETAARALAGTQQGDDLQQRADELRQQAQAAQQTADATAAQAVAAAQQAHQSPYQQAKMAAYAQQAARQADETAAAAAGWGMGPGSTVHTDPRQALEFLKSNSPKMQRIAELAGRMRGFALDAQRTRVMPAGVPATVGMTQDITRVLPTAAFLLRVDVPAAIRLKQAQQLLEGGLPGYIPQDSAQERGPFVAAVDVSPSMHGGRDTAAKAVALGLAQTARQDGRDYTLYAFASDPKTVAICHARQGWQAHIAWASNSQHGGTDFDMALNLAIEQLEALDAARADCLFISDGEAGIMPATAERWRAFAQNTGARLFYVPVGRGGMVDIELLADRTIEVAELDDRTGAGIAQAVGRVL